MPLRIAHEGWTGSIDGKPHTMPTETVPLKYHLRKAFMDCWELTVVHKQKGYGGIHVTWNLDADDADKPVPIQGQSVARRNCISCAWRLYWLNKI